MVFHLCTLEIFYRCKTYTCNTSIYEELLPTELSYLATEPRNVYKTKFFAIKW